MKVATQNGRSPICRPRARRRLYGAGPAPAAVSQDRLARPIAWPRPGPSSAMCVPGRPRLDVVFDRLFGGDKIAMAIRAAALRGWPAGSRRRQHRRPRSPETQSQDSGSAVDD